MNQKLFQSISHCNIMPQKNLNIISGFLIHRIIFLIFFIPSFLQAQLSMIIEEWNKDKDLKNASIGFSVMDAKTSEPISEYNSHLALIPASTQKIITTSAALHLLGANYRYETKIYYTGTFIKETGILNGDLIIVGSGDPTLQSENFSKDNLLVTDKWAKALKEKGLKEIKGKIIGDASCFDRSVPGNWTWEDISNYYGAAPCGLSFMDNKFKIVYSSKEAGSKAKLVSTMPSYLNNTLTITSNVIAGGTEDEAYVYGDPFSYLKEVKGTIPPNKTNFEVEAVLPDPALLCAENLYSSLIQLGITCDPKSISSNYQKENIPMEKQLIYSYFSPTLDKIIFHTNMKSNNHYCETLLRTIGKGDMNTGITAVKNFWQNRGLAMDEAYMKDGSGLSRINTLTTDLQATLLSKMYRDSAGSNYRVFNTSLPIAGKQGSMSNIGKGKLIENNMRAKTGYINRARGYCGYVKSKSGKDIAFSVLFNNYNCSPKEAKLKIERFLIELGEL